LAEEEKEFEVVDKRKVKMDSEGNVVAEPEEPEAEPQEQEEFAGLPPVDIYAILKSFISLLSAHTWQWLGLMKNPITGSLDKDLAQAKIAIDSISLMAGQIQGNLDESEQRELQALLADLRMNYVQQSAKGS
jgi:hypothetical protein